MFLRVSDVGVLWINELFQEKCRKGNNQIQIYLFGTVLYMRTLCDSAFCKWLLLGLLFRVILAFSMMSQVSTVEWEIWWSHFSYRNVVITRWLKSIEIIPLIHTDFLGHIRWLKSSVRRPMKPKHLATGMCWN